MIADSGDKLSPEVKAPVEAAIAALKTANEGTDVEAINAAIEALNTAQHQAAEELYKQPDASAGPQPGDDPGAATGGAEPSADAGSDGDEVIDAEVVEDDK
jgi:molecular chaperone DnaK